MIARNNQTTRPYIYELDFLRTITPLMVIVVHVLAFTSYLNPTATGLLVHNGVFTSFHFTREIFIFVTALAMTYAYFGKPFSMKSFWLKRGIGVLLPYCLWSIAYTWVNTPPSQHSPEVFAYQALTNILSGNASYQLYYILLTIEFYIVLPLFLRLLTFLQKFPWRALLISFALQVLLWYLDFQYLQQGSLASGGIWKFIADYQDRILLNYQFYFILGGLAALYLKQARTFILKHGSWSVAAFVVVLGVVWLNFLYQGNTLHLSYYYATSVYQPVMAFYSTTFIVFLCWLASLWARRTNHQGQPKWYRFWHTLSDASFGIYLVHVFILTELLTWVVPEMPGDWPVALRIFLTWLLTAGGAALISVLLAKTPLLSRLVGRKAAWHLPWNSRSKDSRPRYGKPVSE